MTKKKKKVKRKIDSDCGHDEQSISNVYMFHNIKTKLHLFINAYDLEDAMWQFDLCDFKYRTDWKVFLETGHQPS